MFFPVPTRIRHDRDDSPIPWANSLLIAVNVVVFSLGGRTELAVGPGSSWLTVVTYSFAHAGIAHLLGNMWMLWIFGNAVNRRLGNGLYLLTYLGVAAFLGVVARLFCTGFLIGSSGAIFAVVAVAVMLLPSALVDVFYVAVFPLTLLIGLFRKPKEWVGWFLQWDSVSVYVLWFLLLVPVIELWGLWRWHSGSGTWNWTHLVHLLGFVGGIAAVLLMPTRITMKRSLPTERSSWLAGALAIGLVAVLVVAMIVSRPSIRLIRLGKNATAGEIGKAYESNVLYINVTFRAEDEHAAIELKDGIVGTGILVANDRKHGLIVTNRHVVDPSFPDATDELGANVSVSTKVHIRISADVADAGDHSRLTARVVAYHSKHDLALLVVDREFPRRSAVRVARVSGLARGDRATAIGNSLGKPYILSSGIVSGFDDGLILTTCPISPGNSGGPLFLQREGLLAGINSASYVFGQNMNLAIPAEQVLQSLETPAALRVKAGVPMRHVTGTADALRSASTGRQRASESGSDAQGEWIWTNDGRDKDLVMKLAKMVPLVE